MVTKQAIELGTISFVQERYRELDIAGDPAELFRQAAHLRERIERHRSRATTAIPVGFLILAIGFGVRSEAIRLGFGQLRNHCRACCRRMVVVGLWVS